MKRHRIFLMVFTFLLALSRLTSSSPEGPETDLMASAVIIGSSREDIALSVISVKYDESGLHRYNTITSSGKSVGECLENIFAVSRRNVLFGQLDAVLIEEELIKDKITFSRITDFLRRDPYIGYGIYIFGINASLKETGELIKNEDEKIIAFLDDIIINDKKPDPAAVTLSEILSEKSCAVPVADISSSMSVRKYLAVNNGEYRTDISRKYLIPYRLANGISGKYFFSSPLGEFSTTSLSRSLSFSGGVLEITLSGKFSAISLNGYTSLQGKMISRAEEYFNMAVLSECKKIAELSEETSADLVGLNDYLCRFHHKIYAQMRGKEDLYEENIRISFEADFTYDKNGLMY